MRWFGCLAVGVLVVLAGCTSVESSTAPEAGETEADADGDVGYGPGAIDGEADHAEPSTGSGLAAFGLSKNGLNDLKFEAFRTAFREDLGWLDNPGRFDDITPLEMQNHALGGYREVLEKSSGRGQWDYSIDTQVATFASIEHARGWQEFQGGFFTPQVGYMCQDGILTSDGTLPGAHDTVGYVGLVGTTMVKVSGSVKPEFVPLALGAVRSMRQAMGTQDVTCDALPRTESGRIDTAPGHINEAWPFELAASPSPNSAFAKDHRLIDGHVRRSELADFSVPAPVNLRVNLFGQTEIWSAAFGSEHDAREAAKTLLKDRACVPGQGGDFDGRRAVLLRSQHLVPDHIPNYLHLVLGDQAAVDDAMQQAPLVGAVDACGDPDLPEMEFAIPPDAPQEDPSAPVLHSFDLYEKADGTFTVGSLVAAISAQASLRDNVLQVWVWDGQTHHFRLTSPFGVEEWEHLDQTSHEVALDISRDWTGTLECLDHGHQATVVLDRTWD